MTDDETETGWMENYSLKLVRDIAANGIPTGRVEARRELERRGETPVEQTSIFDAEPHGGMR